MHIPGSQSWCEAGATASSSAEFVDAVQDTVHAKPVEAAGALLQAPGGQGPVRNPSSRISTPSLAHWRQGDFVLGEMWFVHRFAPTDHSS